LRFHKITAKPAPLFGSERQILEAHQTRFPKPTVGYTLRDIMRNEIIGEQLDVTKCSKEY
jgi:hypothetical protein